MIDMRKDKFHSVKH